MINELKKKQEYESDRTFSASFLGLPRLVNKVINQLKENQQLGLRTAECLYHHTGLIILYITTLQDRRCVVSRACALCVYSSNMCSLLPVSVEIVGEGD